MKKENMLAVLAVAAKAGRKDLVRRRLQAVQIREREGPETLIIGPSE
jgi:hypothetical protein